MSGIDLGDHRGICASCGARRPNPGHEDMGRTTCSGKLSVYTMYSIPRTHFSLLIPFSQSLGTRSFPPFREEKVDHT